MLSLGLRWSPSSVFLADAHSKRILLKTELSRQRARNREQTWGWTSWILRRSLPEDWACQVSSVEGRPTSWEFQSGQCCRLQSEGSPTQNHPPPLRVAQDRNILPSSSEGSPRQNPPPLESLVCQLKEWDLRLWTRVYFSLSPQWHQISFYITIWAPQPSKTVTKWSCRTFSVLRDTVLTESENKLAKRNKIT